jgi:hypothetical protein
MYHNERGNPHKEPTWFAEDHPSSIKYQVSKQYGIKKGLKDVPFIRLTCH